MTPLPEDVRQFLHQQYIESVEQLEVAAPARRTPERGWTSHEVATASTAIPPRGSPTRMLLGQGLLREREPGCFQYAPRGGFIRGRSPDLDRMYRERRVAVITLIASKPIEKCALSDAFRIRRDEEDN